MDTKLMYICVCIVATLPRVLTADIDPWTSGNCVEALGSVKGDHGDVVTSGSQCKRSQRTLLQRSMQKLRRRAMVSAAAHSDSGPISNHTMHWSGGAVGWLARFPNLQISVMSAATHADRCVVIWKALGENHWMQFVDGRAHGGGPNVFDNVVNSHPGTSSGKKTFENQEAVFGNAGDGKKVWAELNFSSKEAWESRWTVGKLAAMHMFFAENDCHWPSCTDAALDSGHCFADLGASEKKSALEHILAEYYSAIDAIEVPISESAGAIHIQHALPHIAVLYHKLAILHAFRDGNSRSRTMVLQTELVRQGGHPAVLWDNYRGIYMATPIDWADWPRPGHGASIRGASFVDYLHSPHSDHSSELREFLLDGWCGWELTYSSRASPFIPFVEHNGALLSTPHSQYDAARGICQEGPPRSFWVAPFDKNNPDQSSDNLDLPSQTQATTVAALELELGAGARANAVT